MARPTGSGMGSWAALKTGASLTEFLDVCAGAEMPVVEIGLWGDHGDFQGFVDGNWIANTAASLKVRNLRCVALAVEFPGGPLAVTDDHSDFLSGVEAFCKKLATWNGGPRDVRIDTKTFPEHFSGSIRNNPDGFAYAEPSDRVDHERGVLRILSALKQAVTIAGRHGVTLHDEVEPGFAPSSIQFAAKLAEQTGVQILIDFCHVYAAWIKAVRQIDGEPVADFETAFQSLAPSVTWLHACGGNGELTDMGDGMVTTDHFLVDDPRSDYDCAEVARVAARRFPNARILDVDYCGNSDWAQGAANGRLFCDNAIMAWRE